MELEEVPLPDPGPPGEFTWAVAGHRTCSLQRCDGILVGTRDSGLGSTPAGLATAAGRYAYALRSTLRPPATCLQPAARPKIILPPPMPCPMPRLPHPSRPSAKQSVIPLVLRQSAPSRALGISVILQATSHVYAANTHKSMYIPHVLTCLRLALVLCVWPYASAICTAIADMRTDAITAWCLRQKPSTASVILSGACAAKSSARRACLHHDETVCRNALLAVASPSRLRFLSQRCKATRSGMLAPTRLTRRRAACLRLDIIDRHVVVACDRPVGRLAPGTRGTCCGVRASCSSCTPRLESATDEGGRRVDGMATCGFLSFAKRGRLGSELPALRTESARSVSRARRAAINSLRAWPGHPMLRSGWYTSACREKASRTAEAFSAVE